MNIISLLLIVTATQTDSLVSRYANGITAEGLKEQLYIVAGADMEGRETGTAGQHKAAAYITDQFRKAGLQPGANGAWEQYFSLHQDTLTAGNITANGKEYLFGRDFYTSIGDSKNEAIQSGEVVFAGYGISAPGYDSYKGLDVKGKIVVVLEGEPRKNDTAFVISGNRHPSVLATSLQKQQHAAGLNVKALLIVNETAARMGQVSGNRLRRTGVYVGSKKTATVNGCNVYYISPAMAAGLLGLPAANLQQAAAALKPLTRKLPVKITFEKGIHEMKASNVLGFLEGTDKKEELVFITAHYDHLGKQDGQIHYGADDDGSGTVAVIEMAAAFARAKKDGHGPRRSIVFMTVSGEEKGLLGSRYYTENPVYPLEQTVADLNIDMIGRIDPGHEKDTNYVYIIGDDKLSSELRPINEQANAHTGLQLDYKYNDPADPNRFYYRSDHYMFAQHNIPIIFYFNGTHADYHRPSDTVEKISYDLMARRAQLVFYTAWNIANRENRVKVDRHTR